MTLPRAAAFAVRTPKDTHATMHTRDTITITITNIKLAALSAFTQSIRNVSITENLNHTGTYVPANQTDPRAAAASTATQPAAATTTTTMERDDDMQVDGSGDGEGKGRRG